MSLLSDSKALNDKGIYWESSLCEHFILIFMRETTNTITMRKLKYRGNKVRSDLSNIPQLLLKPWSASIWTHDLMLESTVLALEQQFSYVSFLTY